MTDPRPVSREDLFRLRFLQAAVVSPDETRLVYAVSHVGSDPADAEGKKQKEFSTLHLLDLASGDSRPLTSGQFPDGGPAWSPDGQRIAFLSARGKLNGEDAKAQIYLLALGGGEAIPVTSFRQGVGGPLAWSNDGRFIAFSALRAETPAKPTDPVRVSRRVYRFNDLEYVEPVTNDLYLFDVASGAVRRLTDSATLKSGMRWSPDDAHLIFLDSFPADGFSPTPRLCRISTGGEGLSQAESLLPDWDVYSAGWLPDGRIVIVGVPASAPIGSRADVWLLPAEGGAPQCVSAAHPIGFGGSLQPDMPVLGIGASHVLTDRAGTAVYETMQIGGAVEVMRCDIATGAVTSVVRGERSAFLIGVTAGQLVYAISDALTPPDVYLSALDGSGERRLTHINDSVLAELAQPRIDHLQFPGADGTPVEGWFMHPTTGAAAPHPTVLYIHGGPHGGFGHIFSFDFHMLAGAGFGVLFINHRGSTGYGTDFATQILGDWGNHDYHDLMAGVDTAIARGLADGDRLGVCGLSGGGNLSCWIVGQTRRFKAAVPENPVTSWLSFYGVSDIGVWFATRELGGHPHEIPEVYTRCSPLTYARHCTTPTLLVQCDHDWRCPPEQSEQFYTALKVAGCTVEMLRLPLGGHASSIVGPLEMRRAQNDALLDWMSRYVLGAAGPAS